MDQTNEKTHQNPSNEAPWPIRGRWVPEDLRRFEEMVAGTYNQGVIRAPVHLSGGNEEALINLFNDWIAEDDWVCSTWRSHYHCLLHGAPPDKLFKDICDGHSITLSYPEHNIITSAIVGGICPIALGIAKAIKTTEVPRRMVWCFVGDMTARSGIFLECAQYARGHDLPITFIVEDNGKSVCTSTIDVWGGIIGENKIKSYRYDLPWPHAGAGQRINF